MGVGGCGDVVRYGVLGYGLETWEDCRADCKGDVTSVHRTGVDWEEDCGCEGGDAWLL